MEPVVVINKPINNVEMDSLVGKIGELTLALTSDEVARVYETAQTAQAFGPILNTSKDNNGVVTHSPTADTICSYGGASRSIDGVSCVLLYQSGAGVGWGVHVP